MRTPSRADLTFWWQEYRGVLVTLAIGGWLILATITVSFFGITPGEPPCDPAFIGNVSSDAEACAQLRAATRAEWQAGLTTLQRLTQAPWVWVIWYVIPLLTIGAFVVLADRLTGPRIADAPAA